MSAFGAAAQLGAAKSGHCKGFRMYQDRRLSEATRVTFYIGGIAIVGQEAGDFLYGGLGSQATRALALHL